MPTVMVQPPAIGFGVTTNATFIIVHTVASFFGGVAALLILDQSDLLIIVSF